MLNLKGNLGLVKYLLTSPELKEHANVNADNGEGFYCACGNGHLDVVQYLLTSPDLTEHVDMHIQNDGGFKTACHYGHFNVIQFLIFEMGFEKTKEVENYFMLGTLPKKNKEQVEQLFVMKNLNENLNVELNADRVKSKSIKV